MGSCFTRNALIGMAIAGLVGVGLRADDDKPLNDAEFVKKAACAGMAEVKAGEAAIERANDAKVKLFAQRMIDDHTKANKELEELAGRKSWTIDKTIDEKHQKELDKLASMSGQEFDRAYMECQLKAHEHAVKMFEKESEGGQDADLKAWAAKTLPTLREHLTMAKEAAEKKDR